MPTSSGRIAVDSEAPHKESGTIRHHAHKYRTFLPSSRPRQMLTRTVCPVVLIVDSDPFFRHGLADFLGNRGYRSIVAQNGEEALAKMGSEDVDLVIMDSQMPMVDGLEVTRRIRARKERFVKVPIIGFSIFDTEEDRRASIAAGMDMFMSKHVGFEALANVITKIAKH